MIADWFRRYFEPRQRLVPLKFQTRVQDHVIIALDQKLREEHEAAQRSRSRLDHFIGQMGEAFVGSVRNMERDIDQER